MQGFIHQINVNPNGGVPKFAVERTQLLVEGVAGDKQRHLQFHGGPMRAVCLYSLELIETLNAEGHSIRPGDAGENLTIAGINWAAIIPGARLTVGDAEIEITKYAAPCEQIAFAFSDQSSKRISQKVHPGWSRVYAKILREAEVVRGDRVCLIAL